MKDSARCAKIVEWSDEDQCYVGSAPGLILGGCHGDDERKVFDELCDTAPTLHVLPRPRKPPAARVGWVSAGTSADLA